MSAAVPDQGTVFVAYDTPGPIPRAITELVASTVPKVRLELDEIAAADYLVTTASLSAAVEREAARYGATPVILPEGRSFLRETLSRRTGQGRCVVIIHRAGVR